jgi:transcriptional regulator with PAS, ATPase and Fis domain
MKPESTLHTIHALTHGFANTAKGGGTALEWLYAISQELPFANYAFARVLTNGTVPKDQYVALSNFPVYDPKILSRAIELQQTVIDPMSQILAVPCSAQGHTLGVLLAKNQTSDQFSEREQMLIELAASEISILLTPQEPGLTTTFSQKPSATKRSAPTIVGQSDRLRALLSMIDRVAPTSASVLILGESGTGKELIARRIHSLSERADRTFVAVNCGALQETLLESELFGHEKGSFTGAVQLKKGLVEVADGGSLFLDEIGEMAPSLQAKMLRFLQEGEFYRVGGKEPLRVDARIISATNRELDGEVARGRFREDLYYRLNTITLKAPPLRERKDDLRLLIQFLAPGVTERLTPECETTLKNYRWPGNIRELQNTLERIKIMAPDGAIGIEHLPTSIRGSHLTGSTTRGPDTPFDMSLEDLERHHILRCLGHFEGNKTKAAQSLGITLKTLYNKLHRYGLVRTQGEEV